MSIITFFHDIRTIAKEMRRAADALERIAPLPEEPVELKPEEAITYVDPDKIAADELKTALEQEYDKMREAELESDGGLGVFEPSDRG